MDILGDLSSYISLSNFAAQGRDKNGLWGPKRLKGVFKP
jgi:hypothetical protein